MRRVSHSRHLYLCTFVHLIILVYDVVAVRAQHFIRTGPTDLIVRDRVNHSAEKKARSRLDCGQMCEADEECKFFEFNKTTKMCRMASDRGSGERVYFKYRACPADKGYFLWIYNDMTLCVMHSLTELNYSDSFAFCKKDNGHHFLIESDDMRAHLIEILNERRVAGYIWMDGFDANGVDKFLTWRRTPLPWQEWYPGNPNNGGEDCVEARPEDDYDLRDTFCYYTHQIVCQLDMY